MCIGWGRRLTSYDGRLTIILHNGDTTAEIDTSLIDDIEREINVNCGDGYYMGDNAPPL